MNATVAPLVDVLRSQVKHLPAVQRVGAVTGVAGVSGIHDLHIWTVTSGFVAMSGHIEVTDERSWIDVLTDLTQLLRERFGIAHVTLQPEPARAGMAGSLGCSLDSPEGLAICLASNGRSVERTGGRHHHH